MDVESFTFHSTVVSSGLEHRLCVCGSRVRGIFLVNPGEMTSSAIIPGPVLASGTAGVRLCVWTQNPFFSPSQTDCIQDNNTYSPTHRCKYDVAECVCMCACPNTCRFMCAVAAADHKLAQKSLAIQSHQD